MGDIRILNPPDLGTLIVGLRALGYPVTGPTPLVPGEIRTVSDLPRSRGDE